MEEIEVPTESIQEHIHHEAAHSNERWITQVALSSALLAVLAAITALLSGHHANEAMIEQIQASDQWAFFQAKGIKATIVKSKMELMALVGKKGTVADGEKFDELKKQQDEISELAKEKEQNATHHLSTHLIFARGVTMFQVAIAIAAVAVLVRQRRFWFLGLAFGAAGLAFLGQGLLTQ